MAKQQQEDQSSTVTVPNFSEQDLSDADRKDFQFVKERIIQLQESRKNHYGINLDQRWTDADKDYLPHRLTAKENRVIASDEDKGWRSSLITLGSNNWQSDISQSNPFVKIQTALSILIDQNPAGVFTPTKQKFQATTELMKQLYQRSWEYAKSKQQLKLFVFNLAKYGWACARTFPLRVERDVKVMTEYNPEKPNESKYEKKTVLEYNDIFRENLDPRNVWIDDMAKPNNMFSVRDWCWRKVYDLDVAEEEFGKYKLFKKVVQGGIVTETIDGSTANSSSGSNAGAVVKEYQTKNLVEVYFYENRIKDMFWVIINGVPVIMESLPVADFQGVKKLSLWQTYWNLRHAESPYGIGIYEAIRYDQYMLDRIRNMTLDQLTLSIYKMWFYQGTDTLQNTGEITIVPGQGKKVLDPKNISWLEVPPPGKDAYMGIEMMRKDVDEVSGITDPLLGQVTGKTAFEIAQSKEAALKRLKNPMENILEALNNEAYITLSLIQLLYSIPEVYEITDPRLIDDYLKETQADPELFSREGGKFMAHVYPEFPLNLEKDEKGNLTNTKDTKFFRIKPRFLSWEGIINVKSESILTPSKQIDKALALEFYNMYIPLVSTLSQERMMALQGGQPVDFDNLPHGKIAKELPKLYDKDPRDVLPDIWLQGNGGVSPEQMQAQQPLFSALGGGQPQPQPGGQQPQPPQPQMPNQPLPAGPSSPQAPQANTFVNQPNLPTNPRGFGQKLVAGLGNLIRGR